VINESLAQEYNRRFSKKNMTLTVPKPPRKMEWFEEDELAKCIFEMLQTEMELERAKQQIALKGDFNIADAYGVFDLSGTGKITRLQFEEVCNLYRQYPKSYELQLILGRYDLDGDGALSFSEFSDMFLPRTEAYK
jgi:Ca2+-binding EF-hand superfamily protein